MIKTQARLEGRALCNVRGEGSFDLPPDVLFNLLADPNNHLHIFDAIEACDSELLEARGGQSKYRLDYRTRWQFWKVSGVCDNKLHMWTDRDAGTVTFKLREPGFLSVYEGKWTIKPADGQPIFPPAAGSTTAQARATSLRSRVPMPASADRPFLPSPPATTQALQRANSTDTAEHSTQQHAAGRGGMLARAGSGGVPAPAASITSALESLGQVTAAAAGAVADRLGHIQLGTAAAGRSLALYTPACRDRTSIVTIEKTMSPKLQPPYPLNHTLKGQASRQVQDMAAGLANAARKVLAGQPLF